MVRLEPDLLDNFVQFKVRYNLVPFQFFLVPLPGLVPVVEKCCARWHRRLKWEYFENRSHAFLQINCARKIASLWIKSGSLAKAFLRSKCSTSELAGPGLIFHILSSFSCSFLSTFIVFYSLHLTGFCTIAFVKILGHFSLFCFLWFCFWVLFLLLVAPFLFVSIIFVLFLSFFFCEI